MDADGTNGPDAPLDLGIGSADADPAAGSASSRLAALTKAQRRWIIVRLVLRIVATTTLLLLVYFVAPLDGALEETEASTLALLLLGLAGVTVMIVWQTRLILNAEYPGIRAIEALAMTTPIYLTLFATVYYLIARSNPASFTEPLDRVSSLYFTITVFATVGFGDIAAKTQGARVVVMVQMVLDLLILGLGLRLFLTAVRLGQRRRDSRRAGQGPP